MTPTYLKLWQILPMNFKRYLFHQLAGNPHHNYYQAIFVLKSFHNIWALFILNLLIVCLKQLGNQGSLVKNMAYSVDNHNASGGSDKTHVVFLVNSIKAFRGVHLSFLLLKLLCGSLLLKLFSLIDAIFMITIRVLNLFYLLLPWLITTI